MPLTSAGSARSRIVSESAPVPHPTSSQRPPVGISSQSRKVAATARLQRPMYGSYRSPSCQNSACMAVIIPRCPPGRRAYASVAMGDARDFRIEQSELRGDDEFTEFSSEDLPYYSDWHGSFEKLPWATDDESLRAAAADVAIVGAPLDDAVSSRPGARFGPRAIRMAPTVWSNNAAWSIQQDVAPYALLKVVDAGDAPVVPARLDRGLRVIHEKVFRVAGAGPIPIVLGGDHSITYPSAAAVSRDPASADASASCISTRTRTPAPSSGARSSATERRCAG